MDYSRSAGTALAQIADKGRTITLSSNPDQVYDPATDTFTDGDPITVSVKALFTGYKQNQIDGEIIKSGDKRVLIAAAAMTGAPDKDAVLTDGNVQYQVIDIDTLQPGDAPILYMLQVRR